MRLGPTQALDPVRFSAFEALRARVGVVDATGRLVWANRAWLDVRRDHGQDTLAAVALGRNVIAVLQQARGGAPRLVAAGIRAVLAGESAHFALECAIPELRGRRAEISITPAPGGIAAAVIMQADVHPSGIAGRTLASDVEQPPGGVVALRSQTEAVNSATEALTPREFEVLQLMARGLDNAAIAERLDVGYATVRGHVRSIMAKLGARSRLAAVVGAFQRGIVPPPSPTTIVGSGQDARRVNERSA
jgi:DNA-binding NarL/FixJ family response regulator